MTKDEKRIYVVGILVGLAIIAECVVVLIGENRTKKAVYACSATEISETVAEEETTVKEAKLSLMPCVATDEFREWCETYSVGETSEETSTEPETEQETSTEPETTVIEETYTEETTTEVETGDVTEAVTWYVNGEQIDRAITDGLYDALARHGISDWMSGALAQVYQESHAQRYAVSSDGRDHGILQYRAQFWDATSAQYGWGGADIYDIYAQFDIYAQQMANRFGSGMSIPDAVSRHMTSDYGGYNEAYWNQVSRWLSTVEMR